MIKLAAGLDFNVKEEEESRIPRPEPHSETVVPFTEPRKTTSLGLGKN